MTRIVKNPWAVVIGWALTRTIIAAMGLEHLPYYGNDVLYNDLDVYSRWTNDIAAGHFPVGDDLWQYPPLAAPVIYASRLFGEGRAAFVALALVVDFLILVVLLVDGHRRERVQGAWLWVLAAGLVGPLLLGRFDLVPTLFAVLAVVWVSRPIRSGVASALGALLKVWPVLMLLAIPRRSLPPALAAFVIVSFNVLLIAGAWSSGGLSFLGNQRSRGIQEESVAALPFVIARAFGAHIEYIYRFGSVEVEAAGANTAGAVVTVIGLLLISLVAWWRLRGRLEAVGAPDVALTVVLISVATSRVFSPQYDVWLLALGALCLADERSRLRIPVLMIAIASICAQLIYPWLYGPLNSGAPNATILQSVRIVLIVGATLMALLKIRSRGTRRESGRHSALLRDDDQDFASVRI